MPIKHKFVSQKVDGTDITKVRPSNWNDLHDLSNFFDWGVTLSGTVNGTNAIFILPNLPINSKILLIRNGIVQTESLDYTINGVTVTYVTGSVPQIGDTHSAFYFK